MRSLRLRLIQLCSGEALDEPFRNGALEMPCRPSGRSAKGTTGLCSVKGHDTSVEAAAGWYTWISSLLCSSCLWINAHFSLASGVTAQPVMPSRDKQGRWGPALLYQAFIAGLVAAPSGILAAWNKMAKWKKMGVCSSTTTHACVLPQGCGAPCLQQIFWHRLICSTSKGQQNKLMWRQDTDQIPAGWSSLI